VDSEEKLERSKRRARAGGAAPALEPLVPEVRTASKWKPAPLAKPFRPDAQIVAVWRYGLPFAQINGFHDWLATSEVDLFNLCSRTTDKKVTYLGTFLHVESGTPMYETRWGYAVSQKVSQKQCEQALETGLRKSAQLRTLVEQLRSYWARDPGRSEHLYGFASNYRNVSQLESGGPFWDVTIGATKIAPF
jgi:hypothetical protein